MNYQGRIQVEGVNFSGSGRFKFAIINSSGEVSYWSNDGTSVSGSEPVAVVTLPVDRGYYAVHLGDTNLANMQGLASSVFTQPELYLRVWFDDGAHGFERLLPDQRLSAVPSAFIAETVRAGALSADQVGAAAADLSNVAARSRASPLWPLRNTWDKLHRIRAGEVVQLRYGFLGDSMGALNAEFIGPILQRMFGRVGFFGWAGTNETFFPQPAGNISGDDFSKSPSGQYVEISASLPALAAGPGSQSPCVWPYGQGQLFATDAGVPGANRVTVFYTREPGVGSFRVQYATNSAGNDWVDAPGLSQVDAASETVSLGIAAAMISPAPTKVTNLRAVHISGGAIKIIGFRVQNTAAAGVELQQLCRGTLLVQSMAESPLTAALLAELAPQLITIEAKDNNYAQGLDAMIAHFHAATTDFVFMGTSADQLDIANPGTTAVYNRIPQAKAEALAADGICAVYFDPLEILGTYAQTVALGWMADVTHRNQRASGLLASAIMERMGLSSYWGSRSVLPVDARSGTIETLQTTQLTAQSLSTGAFTSTGALSGASVKLTNSTGSGTLSMAYQSTPPPSGPGSATAMLHMDAAGRLVWSRPSNGVSFDFLGSGRLITFPDRTGTVLLQDNLFNDTTNTAFRVWNSNTTLPLSFTLGSATNRQGGFTIWGANATTYGTIPRDIATFYSNYPSGIGLVTEGGPVRIWIDENIQVAQFDATGMRLKSGVSLRYKEGGTGSTAGLATLVSGQVQVNTTAVTAFSRIKLTTQSLGTISRPAAVGISARAPGVSFTIMSSDSVDTSSVYWEISEPCSD